MFRLFHKADSDVGQLFCFSLLEVLGTHNQRVSKRKLMYSADIHWTLTWPSKHTPHDPLKMGRNRTIFSKNRAPGFRIVIKRWIQRGVLYEALRARMRTVELKLRAVEQRALA